MTEEVARRRARCKPAPWTPNRTAGRGSCYRRAPVRILFITATRIGDAVLSTGLLDHLMRAHPEARFTIACGPAAEGVFARMPNRERTIVLAKQPWRRHWLALWRQVAGQRWDLVVDLRASAFAWLVRARRRAVAKGGRHPGRGLMQLGALLGLDPPPLPVAWFARGGRGAGRGAAAGPAPWLALGPTANWDRKVWPAERFVAVSQALTAPDGPLPGARAASWAAPARRSARWPRRCWRRWRRAVDLVGTLGPAGGGGRAGAQRAVPRQ